MRHKSFMFVNSTYLVIGEQSRVSHAFRKLPSSEHDLKFCVRRPTSSAAGAVAQGLYAVNCSAWASWTTSPKTMPATATISSA